MPSALNIDHRAFIKKKNTAVQHEKKNITHVFVIQKVWKIMKRFARTHDIKHKPLISEECCEL